MKNSLLPLSIYLIPFQFLGISVFSTRIDLSVIAFILWLLLWSPKKNIIYFLLTISSIIVYTLFTSFLYEIPFSFSRIISSSLFYSFLINCIFLHKQIPIKQIIYCRYSVYLSFITCFLLKISKVLLPVELANQGFTEPSYAALFYSAFLLFNIISIGNKEQKYLNFITFPLVIYILLTTRGIHILTFIVTVAMILIYRNFNQVKNQLKNIRYIKISSLKILFVFFILSTIIIFLTRSSYFMERVLTIVATSQLDSANLSGLAWLSGINQVKESIQECPLLGCGAGSPGVFKDISFFPLIENMPYGWDIESYETFRNLNRYDCYSLFFRSIVEFGIFAIFLWFYFIKNLLKKFFGTQQNPNLSNLISFIGFLITFAIGSLIKEPHLFASITFTPLMFLGLFLNHSNKQSITI